MFDGWVLKGEKFPSLQDHPLPLHQRYRDYCSSTGPGAASRSSQNVAMIFFRIHNPDAGFTLAIKKLRNPFRESLRAVREDMRDEKAENVNSLSVNQTKCQTLKKKYSLASKSDFYMELLSYAFAPSESFALGRALIKAESDRERLNEWDAPVFQLLDKQRVKQHNNRRYTHTEREREGGTDTKTCLNGLSKRKQHLKPMCEVLIMLTVTCSCR